MFPAVSVFCAKRRKRLVKAGFALMNNEQAGFALKKKE
jgi:hypothetical protein